MSSDITESVWKERLEYAVATHNDYKFAYKNNKIHGRIVASCLFPSCFTLKEGKVLIEHGLIHPESCPIDKKILARIVHLLYLEYSPNRSAQFISECQFLTDAWIEDTGFSMGLDACLMTSPEIVSEEVRSMMASCAHIATSDDPPEIRERKMESAVNGAMNVSTRIAKSSMLGGDENAMNVMLMSGAKGSVVNCASITGFVGQQNLDGRRLPLSLGDRALPHYEWGDEGPAERGFIFNSYLTGLNPQEYFFHAQAGRRGIVDTSIRTADSGYNQKKMVKKMEDFMVEQDGSVRTATGQIVQFLYGDDGFDAKRLYRVKDLGKLWFCDVGRCVEQLESTIRSTPTFENETPRELYESEIEMCLAFLSVSSGMSQTHVSREMTEYIRGFVYEQLSEITIRPCLIAKLCRTIRDRFESAKAVRGLNVGLVASLSIGETTTQLTLSNFHSAGQAKDVTQGVPRLREILNASVNPKTPSCTIYSQRLRRYSEECKTNDDPALKLKAANAARILGACVERVTIGSISNSITFTRNPAEEWWDGTTGNTLGVFEISLSIEKCVHYGLDSTLIAQSLEAIGKVVMAPLAIGRIRVYSEITISDDEAHDVVIRACGESIICGIQALEKVSIRKELTSQEWVVDTKGSDLQSLLGKPFIDSQRTTTNVIWEIYHTLGIEAARAMLIEELTSIISFDGTYVDPRHISLLIDSMTYRGTITPVNRYGISRNVGPIAKGLFERTVDNYAYSATFTEHDSLSGLSASVMFGTLSRHGTGGVTVSKKKMEKVMTDSPSDALEKLLNMKI